MPGPLGRLLYPVYKSLETRAHLLRYLFVEITQRCNLSCLHCGSDCGRDAQREELSTEEWLRFFGELPKKFDRRELVLVVTGGEPFCAPRFDEILGALRDNQLAWGMVSNGWALTDANVAKVLAHGLTSMTVSLDGLAASHDWLRGRAGSFERAIRGIELAARSDMPFFDVVTCVNPRNLDELPRLREVLQRIGVRAWRLFTIFPKGRAAQNRELRLDDAQMRRLFGFIREERERLAGSGFHLNYSCEGYLPRALDEQVRDEPYFCRAGISIGSVLCDGAISACPNISRSLVQGNVRSDDLREVWETRFQAFRDRGWMQTGPCAGCAEFKRCQGNSLHLWDDQERQTALCHHRILA